MVPIFSMECSAHELLPAVRVLLAIGCSSLLLFLRDTISRRKGRFRASRLRLLNTITKPKSFPTRVEPCVVIVNDLLVPQMPFMIASSELCAAS